MKRLSLRSNRRRPPMPFRKKLALALAAAVMLILMPASSANAVDVPSWLPGGNCSKPGLPTETYGAGFDGLAGLKAYPKEKGPQDFSPYGQYGTAGLYWNWAGVSCFDFSTPVGNQVANLVFNIAKTVDTVTITVYRTAASEDIVNWLKDTSDNLITNIGKALKVGYLTLVIMLGALALIWWGLFKRRATKVTEGTVWMVCAAAAFIILINRPEIFTSAGSGITKASDAVVSAALSPMAEGAAVGGETVPAPRKPQNPAVCIPQKEANYPQNTGKWTDVNKNVNTMWSVLICKPWLQGEFGTADPNNFVVLNWGEKLLHSQAYTKDDIVSGKLNNSSAAQQKQNDYYVAMKGSKTNGSDALFTGKQYLQRIGIAFAALFAALVAGVLILLLSLALIIFKLGFLLLLITGPVFLLIGVHPGWGRVIAVRWVELLLSTLLKQALVAALLGLLLFLYSLIMGSGQSWVVEVMLIALVSFAVFFYRKPFQHLFAAVGTDSIGSRILSNATTGTNAFKTGAAPLTAPHRVNKWALRKTQPLTDAAAATGHPAAMGVAMGSRLATGNATDDDVSGRTAGRISAASGGSVPSTSRPTAGNRTGTSAPPLNLPRPGEGHPNGPNRPGGPGTTPRGGVRPGGGPTTVGPRPGTTSGNAPVITGAGWGPRPGEAPPMWKPSTPSGTPPRNTPTPPRNTPAPSAPTGSGGGNGSRSGAGGWFGSSWRRSGGAAAGPSGPNGPKPPDSGGNNGPRRGGGGGWFGGSSSRDGGSHDPAPPPPRRTERRDNTSGPAPWRKRESAPPLWAKPSKPPAPDIPFWTRPDK